MTVNLVQLCEYIQFRTLRTTLIIYVLSFQISASFLDFTNLQNTEQKNCKNNRYESEFNAFKPRLKSQKPVSIDRRLKS